MLFTIVLLPLAVSAAVLEQRDSAASSRTNVTSEKLQPRYRKTANRNLYKVGPFNLTGSKKGSSFFGDSSLQGKSFFPSLAPGQLCNGPGAPCTILAGQVGLAFANWNKDTGSYDMEKIKKADPSNGIYIHHILTSDMIKKQSPWLSECGQPSKAALNIAGMLGGTAFVGTGEDGAAEGQIYTSEDGTQNTGYHVGESDSFNAWAQLVNYNKDWKMIYLTYDIEWVPGKVGEDIKTATFTVTCGGLSKIKLSESGPTDTTSGNFTFMQDGKILGGRGHMHDGGVKMDMKKNGRFLCDSEAVYGDSNEPAEMGSMGGHSHGAAGVGTESKEAPKSSTAIKTITKMTTCMGPFDVVKGDTLTMVARYDLSKHPLRQSLSGSKATDVMGMWALSFVPENKVKN